MVIERIRFHHVDNVESVSFPSSSVTYPEIVPLSISTRIVVWLQDQIIFKFVDLDSTTEIARLKP